MINFDLFLTSLLGIPSWYEREIWFVDVITQNVKFGL